MSSVHHSGTQTSFEITPTVDPTQEFIEIAYDFSNPLDIVREGISNSFDADATRIEIIFNVETQYGEKVLKTIIKDNGHGMTRNGLQSFFDLGNSLRRETKGAIGEKGHGTKVYLNSSNIVVKTVCEEIMYTATMDRPIHKLHERTTPTVNVVGVPSNEASGTEIIITG